MSKITALELRNIGIDIPEKIPDCAWINRADVDFGIGHTSQDKTDPTKMVFEASVKFNAPFNWIEISISIAKEKP